MFLISRMVQSLGEGKEKAIDSVSIGLDIMKVLWCEIFEIPGCKMLLKDIQG